MRSIGKSIAKALRPLLPDQTDYHMKDQYRLAVALKCYRHCTEKQVAKLTPELVEDFHLAVDNMEDSAVRKFVQSEINKQVIDIFEGLAEADEIKNSSTTRQSANQAKDGIISTKTNFTLSINPSKFPGAGEGVFLHKSPSTAEQAIIPGTVVCLYPGLVHLKEYLKEMAYFRSILPDPNYLLMARTDQSLIDGRTANLAPQNPYALAHKINHCGDIDRPNVLQASYDFPEDIIEAYQFPQHLRKYIPNMYAKEPTIAGRLELFGCYMKGVVMVSCKHINNGDELLMDYKLNPDARDLPTWYRSYDAEDARSRWGKGEEKLV